jgi:phage baseplate assembly protein gpV
MVNQLLNHMMQAFNRSQMNVGYAHLGIISSVDAPNYSVKVLLQPEEIETGFIPYCTPVYGWVAPPSGGEQCLVLFERGNNNVPIGALLLYWDQSRAPGVSSSGDTAAGEMLLRHSSGSYVKLNNAGKVLINGQVEIDVTTPKLVITTTGDVDLTVGGNLTATVTGNTNITSTGDTAVEGDNVTVTGNAVSLGNGSTPESLTFFQELKNWADTHVHSDPQGGNTSAPTVPLPSSASTQIVKAV